MKQVLIIDDDVNIGNMLEEVLTKNGYKVLRAYSGTEALLSLSTFKPDLVLLDLMLPGLSGEEVLPKMQGIPVIIMSAKLDVDNKVNLLLGGAVDYVTKPFEVKELLARITVALRNVSTPKNTVLAFDDLRLDTMRRDYLKEHRKILYTNYVVDGTLVEHLAEIDQACNERMEIILSAMAKQEGVTEALKATDQLEWVHRMNNIHNRAEEIVLTELVYA